MSAKHCTEIDASFTLYSVSPLQQYNMIFTCSIRTHMSLIKGSGGHIYKQNNTLWEDVVHLWDFFQSKSYLPASPSNLSKIARLHSAAVQNELQAAMPHTDQLYPRNHLFHVCAWQHFSSSFSPVYNVIMKTSIQSHTYGKQWFVVMMNSKIRLHAVQAAENGQIVILMTFYIQVYGGGVHSRCNWVIYIRFLVFFPLSMSH